MVKSAMLVALLAWGCGRAGFDSLATSDAGGDAGLGGDPSAVRLVTKHIYGQPGDAFTITWNGGDASDLELRFVTAAHEVVHASPVTTDGQVSLPAAAGIYRVELRDRETGGISFGQASVTIPVTSFTGIQSGSFATYGLFVPQWPNSSMLMADVDDDGDLDWVRSSGKVTSGFADTGFHIEIYDRPSGLFGGSRLDRLPNRRICGFTMFDRDGNGTKDLIAVVDELSTFELQVCVLAGDGTGAFGAGACQTLATGTASSHMSCGGGLVAADFDRDGDIDLAFTGAIGDGDISTSNRTSIELRVLRNTPTMFEPVAKWSGPTTGAGFAAMALGDINDDGRLDLLANGGQPARLHLFRATGDFAFAEPELVQSVHGDFAYDAIVPAYIDSDSTLDVLVVHPDGPSSVFFNNGTASTVIPSFMEQHGARMHVLDLDVDGEVDIIVPYKNRFLAMDRIGAMRKTASNLTQTVMPDATNTIYGAMSISDWVLGNYVFGDWNADGRLDALTLVAYSYQFEVLRGN